MKRGRKMFKKNKLNEKKLEEKILSLINKQGKKCLIFKKQNFLMDVKTK